MKFRDKRRKHRHWKATITFSDGSKFSRTYIDEDKAIKFVDRQKKSPTVMRVRVAEVNHDR